MLTCQLFVNYVPKTICLLNHAIEKFFEFCSAAFFYLQRRLCTVHLTNEENYKITKMKSADV